jgi:hypothetical protein
VAVEYRIRCFLGAHSWLNSPASMGSGSSEPPARNTSTVSRFGARPITYGPGLRERVEQAAPGGIDAASDLVVAGHEVVGADTG